MFNKNSILRQLREVSSSIAAEYDHLYKDNIDNIIGELSISFINLQGIINWEKQEEILDHDFQAALMFWSCVNSLLASLELFRRGYPREHLIILRHNIELISTAYCIHDNPLILEDLLDIEKGVKSSKFITKAKKVHPIIGKIYGMLSDSFVHISTMHIVPNGSSTPLCVGGMYDEVDQTFKPLILSMILTVSEILNSFIEIVFFHKIQDKRFWKYEQGNGIKYEPIDEIIIRQQNILKEMDLIFNNIDI